MKGDPRWTVVIPTFERHSTLATCLERLAPGRQTLDPALYEVVVSDDARSPDTRGFLATLFPWARWVAGPGRGPAANRNQGAAEARGRWLAFTDDDTLPAANWLESLDRQAAAGGEPSALEGRTTCVAGFGTPMHYAPVNTAGGRFWSCNIAVRADRYREIGGFDEGFRVPHMEDQDLRERLRRSGAKIAWVPEAVVDHPPRRQPPGQKLGLLREAEVRYLYKHGWTKPLRWQLTKRIARLRLGIIRSLPVSVDTVLALLSLAAELLVVEKNLTEWERKARAEFPKPDPTRVAQRGR